MFTLPTNLPKFIQIEISGFFASDNNLKEPFVPIDVSREQRTILAKFHFQIKSSSSEIRLKIVS